MKKHSKHRILTTLLVLLFFLIIFVVSYIQSSPAAQLLIGIVSFSESTLNQKDYLAYNIDLMDLFQNYMNSDISFQGQAYIKRMDSFEYSTSGEISGYRSFSQQKMSMTTDMSVLWEDLGGLDLYAEDETVYMIVPMLDNLSCAFDTEVNLFKQAPTLTSDISNDWFRENYTNLVTFLNSIEIEKTDIGYKDEDGTIAREYKMTIPKGQGQFIWDLLGIEAPQKDIVASIYLDSAYKIRKIEFNFANGLTSSTLTITGKHSGTCALDMNLPDNETATMTIVRNPDIEYTNAFDCNVVYNTNTDKTYTITCSITSDYTDTGMNGKISDIVISDGSTPILEGYCSGSITKEESLPDIFADVPVDLSQIEVINWKVIRDNTQDFINAMIGEAKTQLKIFD